MSTPIPWSERKLIIEYHKQRIINANLLAALKETRDAVAAAFRVIYQDEQGLIDFLEAELVRSGVKDGFGKRADEAIQKAEVK